MIIITISQLRLSWLDKPNIMHSPLCLHPSTVLAHTHVSNSNEIQLQQLQFISLYFILKPSLNALFNTEMVHNDLLSTLGHQLFNKYKDSHRFLWIVLWRENVMEWQTIPDIKTHLVFNYKNTEFCCFICTTYKTELTINAHIMENVLCAVHASVKINNKNVHFFSTWYCMLWCIHHWVLYSAVTVQDPTRIKLVFQSHRT
jgi:hypothetical protein